MTNYIHGVFLSILYPQDGESAQTVARDVSRYLEWADPNREWEWDRGVPEGGKVHRGVVWAVVVHDVDNPEQSYVIALARDPSGDAWFYMQGHKSPPIYKQGSEGSHTIYNATDEYKQGNKVAMGHNGPL